ncbi:MAG: dimethylsulfoniopropionate demethylase [Gammaproteobacteria bacterium]|nr:dimethylsulfoniopropionate demethylase [Gammaproteobacteria bacterium]
MHSSSISPPALSLSRRIRQTPYEKRVLEHAPKSMTVYNNTPLATVFHSPQEDYEHLCEYVQLWDVSCQRQVEIVGPAALELIELITPRDISKCQIGQCMYIPLVDEYGGIINDPILLRTNKKRFWLSTADSNVMLWVKGIAYGMDYEVSICDPDVNPLAIQGPKSDDLMANLLGEGIRELPFFRFVRSELAGTSFYIARSGWSGQGGFEIYLEEHWKGLDLWDCIWEAGQIYDIRAGCPNSIDRIERGLISYGNDITADENPYECGLDRFCPKDKDAHCMSVDALDLIRKQGVTHQLVHLLIPGEPLSPPRDVWHLSDDSGYVCGFLTSIAYSIRFGGNIAFALMETMYSNPGQSLYVDNGTEELIKAMVISELKD